MKFNTLILLLLICFSSFGQKSLKSIKLKETTRIERILSADDMQGRRAFSAGNEKAAAFIADEFEKIGLQKWNNGDTYLQTFSMVKKMNANKRTIFTFDLTQEGEQVKLSNVVGVIPGKSKPNEYVIFSGHFDHIGISSRNMQNNDSIFNGANDDAAGTTAMIMLAKYFKKLNNNERTLIFAAFNAEEMGGFGATYFSKQFDPAQVVAMFNIEMIGTESKWGKNSAYITGYEKTNMGEILQKNLTGTSFTFQPDPYPDQQLFYRSDNATLARLGVPAHTISTSKMDSEPNYHKASDEIGTLDLKNMNEIIKAIALSSRGIVAGTETPSRVDTSSLKR
ncbi:MAG: M28 family peptidase [Chitinophagaceae bacterium]